MIELRLALSIDAVREMAAGNEIAFDIDEDGIRIIMRCDDLAVVAFKTQVERALLHMLPVGTLPN